MADLEIQHSQLLVSDLPPLWRRCWQRLLSPAAAAVYLSLRQRPGQTLDSYSFRAPLGLSEKQLVAALQELQRLGFIDMPKHPKDIA